MKDHPVVLKSKNLIPPSFAQAFYAGLVLFGLSFTLGVPIEFIPRVTVAGMSYSLFLSWRSSKGLGNKSKGGRLIPFNHGQGSSKIKMEFLTSTGGYIARESYWQAIVRKLSGSRKVADRIVAPATRPNELDEFTFYSQGLQLREVHVKLFLRLAWRNRQYGKGLSARRWVRNFSQRPAWYQELSPAWYYAAMDLLWRSGKCTGYHLVVRYENSWLSLVNEPALTLNVMKWYEYDRRKQ